MDCATGTSLGCFDRPKLVSLISTALITSLSLGDYNKPSPPRVLPGCKPGAGRATAPGSLLLGNRQLVRSDAVANALRRSECPPLLLGGAANSQRS